jgi:hypothetical protein
VAATTLYSPTIGFMHQATLNFSGVMRGARAFYKLTTGAAISPDLPENSSPVFAVTPEVARPEVFAVFGDLGDNGATMGDLIASAARGNFDTVLCVCVDLLRTHHPTSPPSNLNPNRHVGDMAYDFPDLNSSVGNDFMTGIQGYAATHPLMPAEVRLQAAPSAPAPARLRARWAVPHALGGLLFLCAQFFHPYPPFIGQPRALRRLPSHPWSGQFLCRQFHRVPRALSLGGAALQHGPSALLQL